MAYCLVHRSSMKAGGRNIPLDCSIFLILWLSLLLFRLHTIVCIEIKKTDHLTPKAS